MSERVLITGASGFLGYHIIVAAIDKGLEVYAAIRKNSNIGHLDKLPLQFVTLNYDDIEDMSRQLADHKINYIIHAAGVTKATRQEVYDQINATYTLNLAKAAGKSAGHFKKMVYISSLAAVGPLPDDHLKITEETAPNPVTAYGRSKLLAETGLAEIAIPTTILRPTAVYGPRDKDIFIMIKTVSKGLDPYIGKTLQSLSFVHAKDVAEVAIGSLFINSAGGIYNITDGNSYNRYQFSDIIKIILKRKAFRFHIPFPMVKLLAWFLETTNGWLNKPSVINREKLHELAAKNWVCDISKAKKELAYSPKFDLRSGLEDSIAWYATNKWL
ncbi:MAG: NAD-dependent epimerase/dehydratase family protein [Ferruginibacter sp.]